MNSSKRSHIDGTYIVKNNSQITHSHHDKIFDQSNETTPQTERRKEVEFEYIAKTKSFLTISWILV